jgi:aromatic-L-amino-acid/L-tryptophan decarboxylase
MDSPSDFPNPSQFDLDHPLPHPDPIQMRELGQEALAWIVEHLGSLPDQPIGQTAGRAEMESHLRESPPEEGQGFAQVLRDFQDHVAPFAFRVNHPRFLAFIPSAPSFLSVLGDMLCAGTNFFAGVWLEAAGPAEVELLVLDWFKDFLGYPTEAKGILTSGGSEANLTALVVAREPLSLPDRMRIVLYVTEQRHWSIDRAAKVIGLAPEQVRPVATDDHFRLRVSALADAVRQDRKAGRLPWVVVANAGATNTGAVDPLAELATWCQAERLWLHVDAAYGWPAVLIPAGRRQLVGIAQADSVTLDPHKWFAQTFEAGCLLVRNGPLLARTFAMRPVYLQDVAPADDEINFADHGIALTRRFRALKIWFSVKALGVGWFRNLIGRSFALAELAVQLLREAGCFEILQPHSLSIVCFRYVPASSAVSDSAAKLNHLNLALVERLRQTQRAFLSSTMLGDGVFLRFCFVNWRTTTADVRAVVQLLADLGRTLER